MGKIVLVNHPQISLNLTLPKVLSKTTDINIHFVRVYNDNKTIISIVRLEIKGTESFYVSVTNDETSPARPGEYYGYLLRRNDDGDKSSQAHPDSQTFKKRIEKVLKGITLLDIRLAKQFQRGGLNTQGHNGLRIFQPGMKGGEMKGGWYRLEGGNRFIHVAAIADHVIGCEGLGQSTGKRYGTEYGVKGTDLAVSDFLNKIITAYEDDIKTGGLLTQINITVEDNIQSSIKKFEEISPGKLYKELYKPREKVKPIPPIKPKGFQF